MAQAKARTTILSCSLLARQREVASPVLAHEPHAYQRARAPQPCLAVHLVEGSGLRVEGCGCKDEGLGFRVQDRGCRVESVGLRVEGCGCRV